MQPKRLPNYSAPVPELSLSFPRVWVEFDDPDDAENLYRCDLTWLTSNWHCVYGSGCQGIVAGRPEMGCCALGAHFTDEEDEGRVAEAVKELDASSWENYEVGRKDWLEENEDGERHTRLLGGGCVFQNSPGFAGGGGCALHHLAIRKGVSLASVKPDVCWQLPIRRDYEWREVPDGSRRFVITIEEYTRNGWGPGGKDLNWYCTSNTEAHTAALPVFITEKDTLVELMGKPAYKILARHCEARLAALTAARRAAAHRADPAQVKALLEGMGAHPADRAELD